MGAAYTVENVSGPSEKVRKMKRLSVRGSWVAIQSAVTSPNEQLDGVKDILIALSVARGLRRFMGVAIYPYLEETDPFIRGLSKDPVWEKTTSTPDPVHTFGKGSQAALMDRYAAKSGLHLVHAVKQKPGGRAALRSARKYMSDNT